MEVTDVGEVVGFADRREKAGVTGAAQAGWSRRWLWFAWLGFALCTLVIGTLGAVVKGDPAQLVLGWGIVSDFSIFAISVYALGTGVAVLALWRLGRRRGLGWASFGLRGRLSGGAVLQALAGVVVASVLYLLIDGAFGRLGVGMFWEDRTRLNLLTLTDYSLVVLFAVLFGPLVEELVFRGYVLRMFLERTSRTRAVLWSALIFSSVHLAIGPATLVYIAFWSLIPAYLYLRYKNLYAGILFHVVNNCIAYLAVPMMGW